MVPRAALSPLQTLYEMKRGTRVSLPSRLAHLYGSLRMPLDRLHIISNFATTLDGVVSLSHRRSQDATWAITG